MRGFRIAVMGALSAALMTGGSFAADLLQPVTEVADAVDTSWDGVYIGLVGDAWIESGTVYPAIGVRLGANFTSDNWLFGVRADGKYYGTSGNSAIEVTGRAGMIVNDSMVLYGSAGVGLLNNGSPLYYPIGVGAEFMVADSLSLDVTGEALVGGGSVFGSRVEASLNWHF
ncbi:MAG: hypothetical protein ABL866_13455 [Devosia sp.]